MFWILVLACGGGTGPADSPGGEGSIFEQQETPSFPAQPAPSFPAQPPPDGAVFTPASPAQASTKNAGVAPVASQQAVVVSQDCLSARARLGAAEERVVRLRNRRITPAADRFDDATEVMGKCVRDVTGCGSRAGAYKKELLAAEEAYEKALDQVAEEEAGLFPLTQAVETACYSR
ncbi:MAG: hypothetical protein VX519_05660 [Myxococcota bacterium]|nr:hypothetical protein [Myxococcota bacterium]